MAKYAWDWGEELDEVVVDRRAPEEYADIVVVKHGVTQFQGEMENWRMRCGRCGQAKERMVRRKMIGIWKDEKDRLALKRELQAERAERFRRAEAERIEEAAEKAKEERAAKRHKKKKPSVLLPAIGVVGKLCQGQLPDETKTNRKKKERERADLEEEIAPKVEKKGGMGKKKKQEREPADSDEESAPKVAKKEESGKDKKKKKKGRDLADSEEESAPKVAKKGGARGSPNKRDPGEAESDDESWVNRRSKKKEKTEEARKKRELEEADSDEESAPKVLRRRDPDPKVRRESGSSSSYQDAIRR